MNFPDLIMFGIQGSGKGVQNTLLAQKYPAYQVLDLGMVFRAQAQTDSDLGRNIKKQIDQGNIVSIEDYAAVLAEIMQNSDPNTHFIFDGFVRTLAQKDIFEKATAERRVIGINL
ncbi:MAG TPA: nucleoside monophosphate kinase, partial [Candidatus Gracilibacteria bacterium]|nr:nucleoside monophosphate kinase [Candidatus Gracilibacteria bacterium]